MMKCGPTQKQYKTFNCFTRKQLICLVISLDSLTDKNLGLGSNVSWNTKLNEEELWAILQKKVYNFVGIDITKDSSWISNLEIIRSTCDSCPDDSESIHFFALRPFFDIKKIISKKHIDLVMAQYQSILPKFKFLGVYASDGFKSFTVKDGIMLNAEHRSISWGMVLNTGTSQKGEHWVAVFKSSGHSPLEYFDSEGEDIPESLSHTIFLLSGGHPVISNFMRHQYDKRNCGVYVIFFLLCRALHVPFTLFNEQRINLSDIEYFKRVILNTN